MALPRIWRALRIVLTLIVATIAGVLGWRAWSVYTTAPWTRDGRVRAYVVTVAPEVSGRVVALPVADNQFVHQGDVLFQIDDADYRLALATARAQVQSAQAAEAFRRSEAERRERLTSLSTSVEQQQQFSSEAAVAAAATATEVVHLNQAELALARTVVRSPVDGWVTNLVLQQGDYAQTGMRALSVVDAKSFWVDGYFEEMTVPRLHEGDPASVWLIGVDRPLLGHVQGVARGIQADDGSPGPSGLASVNPVFTWVRLAQRVPVRIALDTVPPGVRLVAGTTASVSVHPPPAAR